MIPARSKGVKRQAGRRLAPLPFKKKESVMERIRKPDLTFQKYNDFLEDLVMDLELKVLYVEDFDSALIRKLKRYLDKEEL